MNIYDQVLASAYYVFREQLNSHIIQQFLILMNKAGIKGENSKFKMTDIDKYMYFDNHKYVLKDGYTISDIVQFIDLDMVRIFQNLKQHRDYYYSNKTIPKIEKEKVIKIKKYEG